MSCNSLKKEEAGSGGRYILRMLREDRPHSSLPDIDSKLDWEGRVIGVNLKAFEMKRPTPAPVLFALEV